MKTINAVTISGNLGRPAETRTTRNGKGLATFSVAVNMSTRTAEGWSTKTNWIPVVWYGDEAADAAPRLGKGQPVVVYGRLNVNEWDDKNGNHRSTVEIVADHVAIVERVRKPESDDQADERPAVWDADIPF